MKQPVRNTTFQNRRVMRVVIVNLFAAVFIGCRRDQSDLRIVRAPLIGVRVLFDGFGFKSRFSFGHRVFIASESARIKFIKATGEKGKNKSAQQKATLRENRFYKILMVDNKIKRLHFPCFVIGEPFFKATRVCFVGFTERDGFVCESKGFVTATGGGEHLGFEREILIRFLDLD